MAEADTPELVVTTPERVAVALPIAGVGHRVLAYLVDAGLMFLAWSALYFACSLALDVLQWVRSLSGALRALAALGLFSSQWLSWTACELLLDGQTPGKRLLGIRVVRADGASVGWTESALRNLLRLLDFLPFFYATGLLVMLGRRDGRRLGDLVAGTVLVRTGRVDLSAYLEAPVLPAAAQRPLTAEEQGLLVHWEQRREWLEPSARAALALRLVRQLSGEDTAPPDGQAAEAWLDALRVELRR